MSKCKLNSGKTLDFCEAMKTELLKTNSDDNIKIFQLVCRNHQDEAVLLVPLMTIINFCPFCGSAIFNGD